MNQYVEVMNTYLAENPMEFANCEMKSLLGMLYCCYHQRKGRDSKQISGYFTELDSILKKISIKEQDQVIDTACALCSAHQREAFEEGLLAGFRLFGELIKQGSLG